MADVVQLPGVTEQVKMVAKLRWLILKNGLRNKNKRWDLIAMVWVSFFSAAIVLGLCLAFYEGGYQFVAKNRAGWTALLYWAIFLWWQVFPIFVAGFGANFEFTNLLRFPLSRRAFYLLGLGYGLSDFGAISSICWIFSIIAGAARARMSVVPAMMLVSLLFVLLNLTMERLVGSWLEKLLAKRRSRELFLGVFVLSMVSLNFLSPALQRWGNFGTRPKILGVIPYLSWLPGSLAGNAVGAAARADAHGYLLGLAGLAAWAGLLSMLLWRRFAAQYSGEEISESPAPAIARKREKRTIVTEEWPGILSPQVAAIVAKEFRYMKRNGFAFLTLILPPIMVFFFTLQFGPGSVLKQHSVKPGLFFPGIMAYLLLILLSPAYNSFAFEGKGIQTYFMAPIGFRDVLLRKEPLPGGASGIRTGSLLGTADLSYWLARCAAFFGDPRGGCVCSDRTVGHCQLVLAELSEENGNRKDERTTEFRDCGVDGFWGADRVGRHLCSGLARRSMDGKSVAADACVCGVDGGRSRWLRGIAQSDERIG